MDWVKFKLPIPVFQQENDEKCLEFFKRIETSLQSTTPTSPMGKEDTVFWFLIGVREDIIPKIPFNPSESMWIDPADLEDQLEKIDKGEKLTGPFRLNRFQNCFNYFICFSCGNWGHKSMQCRNEKPATPLNKQVKRKITDSFYFEDEPEKKSKRSSSWEHNSRARESNNGGHAPRQARKDARFCSSTQIESGSSQDRDRGDPYYTEF